ncbi:MAG: molybdenum cofactor biosynthesis protein MoaE [Hyphomonadaceae bacterium]
MICVQEHPFEPAALLAAFSHPDGGACASFVGRVRGGGVMQLVLEHYPGFTEAEIARIEAEAHARFDLIDTLIVHRHGAMRPGETIVLTAALARHRKDALAAVDYLMDRLKTEAPFWKREITPAGEAWIEPRAEDYAAAAAWERTMGEEKA